FFLVPSAGAALGAAATGAGAPSVAGAGALGSASFGLRGFFSPAGFFSAAGAPASGLVLAASSGVVSCFLAMSTDSGWSECSPQRKKPLYPNGSEFREPAGQRGSYVSARGHGQSVH